MQDVFRELSMSGMGKKFPSVQYHLAIIAVFSVALLVYNWDMLTQAQGLFKLDSTLTRTTVRGVQFPTGEQLILAAEETLFNDSNKKFETVLRSWQERQAKENVSASEARKIRRTLSELKHPNSLVKEVRKDLARAERLTGRMGRNQAERTES
ncbi:hypothetical protein CAPTEDRAFT_217494 [Capitella teleta]|uniref:Uncharacterized protein n=1 Tax=Capitella teleta TaxID=283909 RepID=R7UGJ2_CAPTE|nr:hypothetical protein CAPTEDRAFT_217494 [Capitella teleta]|eukprot:ELU05649.1 hypothetical protein CAPTEDRAFT_217494 [Capitella teleta]